MSESNIQTGGIGFFGLLGILFIGLKLTNYITWSWWLVLMPIYMPICIVLIVLLVVVFLTIYKAHNL